MLSMEMFLFTSAASHKSLYRAIPAGVVGDNQSALETVSSCPCTVHYLTGWPGMVLFKGLDSGPIFRGQDNRGLAECGPLQPGD